jgi:hypothetical protein
VNRKNKMKHMSLYLAIALGFMVSTLTGPMDSAKGTERGRAYAARHHSHAAGRPRYAAWHHHAARRIRHFTGGYSRLTVRDTLWGPAGMPPAPTDFGPHFDFPPVSLNDGPTESPYPN